jgi:hypothetical protein
MRRPWIGGKDFHNFHWTKRTSSRRGHERLREEDVWGSFSCVIFRGKGKRRMMNLSRWWKERKWVGCLGYFERIEVSKIMLGA